VERLRATLVEILDQTGGNMTDMEQIELAIRRAAAKLRGLPATAEAAFLLLADELAKGKPKEDQSR
jgi:hypothetical protein